MDRITGLERLQKLRDQGAISEEEFAREKQRLLDDTVVVGVASQPRQQAWMWAAAAGVIVLVVLVAWLASGSGLTDRNSAADENSMSGNQLAASTNSVSRDAPPPEAGSNMQVAEMDPALKQAIDLQNAIDSGGMPGCFDPSLSGRERAVAERLGGRPCSAGDGSPQGGAGGDDWAGEYQIDADGGGGSLTITRSSQSGTYRASLGIGSPSGCGGGIEGRATVRRGRLEIVSDELFEGSACRVTLTRRGDRILVEEGAGCQPFHGMSCGFSGEARRGGR